MASHALRTIMLKVNGKEVVIDPRTLTGKERQRMKLTLAALDYTADDDDALYATIWVVMTRTDPTLTFDAVLDAVTIGDIESAVDWQGEALDSPEA